MAKLKKILFSFFAAVLFTFAGIGTVWAGAEDSVEITSIDYDNLTLTVQGNGDSSFYFSDYKQKKWEKIVGDEKDGSVTMDISWIPVTKNYVLALKGDQSQKPITVTLPKYNTAFKIVYDKKTGQVTSYKGLDSYKGSQIQYRVNGTTTWIDADIHKAVDESIAVDEEAGENATVINGLREELGFYINEIASVPVYFRTKPLEGGNGEAGERPSKEVKLTIAKKTSAPTVTLNGSSMYLTVPAGVEYRRVGEKWPTDREPTKAKETKLLTDFPGLTIPESGSDGYVVEFRKAATASAQVSTSKFIYINPRRSAEDVGLVTSGTTKFISPTKAEISLPIEEKYYNDVEYEYTVSEEKDNAPVISAKWVSMPKLKTGSDPVSYYLSQTFSSSAFNQSNTTYLYIRAKASGKSGEKDFTFASKCYRIDPPTYPNSSTSTGEISIVGIQGTGYSGAERSLSYSVDKNVVEGTSVSAVNVYAKGSENGTVVTTLKNGEEENKYFTSGKTNEADTTVEYEFKIFKAGIAALLADKKLAADKEYVLGLALENGETVMTKATLKVFPATQISGTSEFKKIAGFDKDYTITLDYGSKNPQNYNGLSIISSDGSPLTILEENMSVKEENGKYIQTIPFSIRSDQYFKVNSDAAEFNIQITHKDDSNLSETIQGLKVNLEQPILDSDNGTASFTKGNSGEDISIGFTLNDDEQVTGGLAMNKISWNGVTFTSGFTAKSTDNSGTLILPTSLLDKFEAGSGHIKLITNGNNEYETNYTITVKADDTGSSGTGEGASGSTASMPAAASFRLMANDASVTDTEEAVKSVSIDSVNYENNTLSLTIKDDAAFYSVNKKTWYGIGDRDAVNTDKCTFNISWVPDTKNYTIYFKGIDAESEDEYTSITFSKKKTDLKVKFDKTSGADAPTLTVTYAEGAELQWRKKASYTWKDLTLDSGKCSEEELEFLRVKGGKIVVRVKAVNGMDGNAGTRYSKEVSVSIPKRGNAPAVKINVSKMKLNTSTALQYYDSKSSKWINCTRNMSIWDIPEVKSKVQANVSETETGTETVAGTEAEAGTEKSDVTILFRKAAKSNAGYSKTQEVVFQMQAPAPSVNEEDGNEVEYIEEDKTVNKKEITKRYLEFNKASKTVRYQYVVVPAGTTFDESTAKWKTVSSVKKVTLNSKAVPGAKVYVRILGTNAKASVPAKLSSACAEYSIEPETQDTTGNQG